MTVVRMLIHRTGGRFDGQAWPPYLDTIDVPQWEADELIAEGHAALPEDYLLDRGYDVLKVPAVDYESGLKVKGVEEEEVDPRYVHHTHEDREVADFDSDFDRDDSDDDFEREEVTAPVKRPTTVDTKARWIEWAVFKGATEAKAAAMTKAQLIKEYS